MASHGRRAPEPESGVMLARYDGKTRYADIECIRHGREFCVVCEVGVAEVVELEVLGAKSGALS